MRPDLTRVLYGAAGTLAVAGLALRLFPMPVGIPTQRGAAAVLRPEPAPGVQQAQALLSYEEIVRADPFVPTRVGRRGTPRTAGRATAFPPRDGGGAVRLYGIASGPGRGEGEAVALIDADPAIPGAEVYRIGEAVRGARIVAITDSTVVLQDSNGRRVLTLPPPARRVP